MKGIGILNPFTKEWQDKPVRFAPDGYPIHEAAYDPDLKRSVLISQAAWDRIRQAVLDGRPDLAKNASLRVLALTQIANSLKWNAEIRD